MTPKLLQKKNPPGRAEKKLGMELPFHLLPQQIERVVSFNEDEPSEILGPKWFQQDHTVVIHAFLPKTKTAWLQFRSNADKESSSVSRQSTGTRVTSCPAGKIPGIGKVVDTCFQVQSF